MQISVREVAHLLKVSDKTIYRWIQENRIPVYKIGDLFRFNRAEIAEWATQQRLAISPQIWSTEDGPDHRVTLVQAISDGGVYYRVAGTTRNEVIRSMVGVMPLADDAERDYFYQMLVAREDLSSTGIGGGVAIPHPRTPLVLHVSRPQISLCFLEHPIDFHAMDGKPVEIFFTVVTPTVRSHLSLLSRLTFVLRDPQALAVLHQRGSRPEIMAAIGSVEDKITRHDQGTR